MSAILPLVIVLTSCSIVQEDVYVKDKVCTVSECTDMRLDKPISVLECREDVRVKAT